MRRLLWSAVVRVNVYLEALHLRHVAILDLRAHEQQELARLLDRNGRRLDARKCRLEADRLTLRADITREYAEKARATIRVAEDELRALGHPVT